MPLSYSALYCGQKGTTGSSGSVGTKDKEGITGDFPGGPVVKTSPSNAGGAGSIPGWGAKIPHALRPKNQKHKTEAIW